MELKIKKLNKGVKLPKYETSGSAGLDLRVCLETTGISISNQDIIIKPTYCYMLGTGIAVEIPKGYVGLVFIRSSVGIIKGLGLVNQVGVIDSDYRGEIKLPIINNKIEDIKIKNGERLAQLVIVPAPQFNIVESENLSDTERDTGGFGSTGEH